ncbi:unnamed protein product [Dovyalis caffra]|uniref:ESCRT-II complex subunit VPS25 n=1 Tax=Dovyalis caffra TaxID=77055 RepID=A0AAV1S4A1_9ROSI|nr:unnamed protein product [Dovyalis caffra]
MPTLNLYTNIPVDAVTSSDILKDATKVLSKIIGKPESYVMVVLHGGVPIVFAGTEAPAAFAEVISIGGLGQSVNAKLSSTIADILQTKLSIDSSRFYIKFFDSPSKQNSPSETKTSSRKRSKFRKFLDTFCSPSDYFSAICLILPNLDRESAKVSNENNLIHGAGSLSHEAREAFLSALVSEGRAEWLDKGHRKCLILWHRIQDWADILVHFVRDNGLEDSVMTVEEIRTGIESRGTELHGIERTILMRVLKLLEHKGKLAIFKGTSADDEGVKFSV